jgi:hypothetical protein
MFHQNFCLQFFLLLRSVRWDPLFCFANNFPTGSGCNCQFFCQYTLPWLRFPPKTTKKLTISTGPSRIVICNAFYLQVQPNLYSYKYASMKYMYTMILSRCYLFQCFLLNNVVSGIYHVISYYVLPCWLLLREGVSLNFCNKLKRN